MQKLLIGIVLSTLVFTAVMAGSFEDDLRKLAEDNAKNYISPLITAFGTNMNAGLYHNAKPHKLLGFDITISFMGAMVPDDALTYTFAIPDSVPFPLTNPDFKISTGNLYTDAALEAPTIFGKDGTWTISPDSSELVNLIGYAPTQEEIDTISFTVPPGIDFTTFPTLMPQVSLGLPMKSEVMLRYFPKTKINDDVGEFSFWGIGIKHSLSQYIPLCPVNIAGQLVYQSLEVGDILTSTHTNFNIQVSKTFLIITPYAGLGIEQSNMEVEYTIEGTGSYFDGQEVKFDIDGDNQFHARVGLAFKFMPFVGVNADYAIGDYNVFTLGAYFSFR